MNSFERFVSPDVPPCELPPPRAEIIEQATGKPFEVVVDGGGIIGATCAWVAALQGFRVVLFAHGDLCELTPPFSLLLTPARYSSTGVLDLVKTLRCVASFKRECPQYLKRVTVESSTRSASWRGTLTTRVSIALQHLLSGSFGALWGNSRQQDFILDAFRLHNDIVRAAQREGALLLSYTDVKAITREESGIHKIIWRDRFTSERKETRGAAVLKVNTHGPRKKTRNSEGHVEAHISSTFIEGIQESSTRFIQSGSDELTLFPAQGGSVAVLKSGDEYGSPQRLFEKVQAILTHSGIVIAECADDRSFWHNSGPHQTLLGTEYSWSRVGGIFSLKGGDILQARHIAQDAMVELWRASAQKFEIQDVLDRPWYSSTLSESEREAFTELCNQRSIPPSVRNRVLEQHPYLIPRILEVPGDCALVAGQFLLSELVWAIRWVGACTWEDLCVRRLGLTAPEALSPFTKESIVQELKNRVGIEFPVCGSFSAEEPINNESFNSASERSSRIEPHPQGA